MTRGRRLAPPAGTARLAAADLTTAERLDDARVDQRRGRRRRACGMAAAVVATAVVGAIGTAPRSTWFRSLEKPSWYPPDRAFAPVWTVLYASIAWSGTRALNAAPADGRAPLRRRIALDLGLNAAWTWTFFRARRPGLALGTIVALDAANVSLVRESGRHDPVAAVALLPYAAWTAFATALTEEIWFRNTDR